MKKIVSSILVVLVIIVLIVITIRFLSGEDNWICQDGKWVKHGQPNSVQPLTECKK